MHDDYDILLHDIHLENGTPSNCEEQNVIISEADTNKILQTEVKLNGISVETYPSSAMEIVAIKPMYLEASYFFVHDMTFMAPNIEFVLSAKHLKEEKIFKTDLAAVDMYAFFMQSVFGPKHKLIQLIPTAT